MCLGGIYRESVFMPLTFCCFAKKIVWSVVGRVGRGGGGAWLFLGDGLVGQTVLSFLVLLRFLVSSTG